MAFGTRTSVYEMDGVGAAPAVNNAADQIARLKGVAQSNSAFNAEQAELQRDWTESQSAKAMQFNAREAAKNRACFHRQTHKNLLGIGNTLEGFGVGLRHFSNVSINTLHFTQHIGFTILITPENGVNIGALSKGLNELIDIIRTIGSKLNLPTLIVTTRVQLLDRGAGARFHTLTCVILRFKVH
jgi:hypothetical protein